VAILKSPSKADKLSVNIQMVASGSAPLRVNDQIRQRPGLASEDQTVRLF
jgi:hypothetical protein